MRSSKALTLGGGDCDTMLMAVGGRSGWGWVRFGGWAAQGSGVGLGVLLRRRAWELVGSLDSLLPVLIAACAPASEACHCS